MISFTNIFEMRESILHHFNGCLPPPILSIRIKYWIFQVSARKAIHRTSSNVVGDTRKRRFQSSPDSRMIPIHHQGFPTGVRNRSSSTGMCQSLVIMEMSYPYAGNGNASSVFPETKGILTPFSVSFKMTWLTITHIPPIKKGGGRQFFDDLSSLFGKTAKTPGFHVLKYNSHRVSQ